MSAKWIGIAAAALFLTACGQTSGTPVAAVSPSSPAAGASPTASGAQPAPSPSPLTSPVALADCNIPHPLGVCVGRAATAEEASGMLAAARTAVEAKYGLKPIASCQNGDNCLIVQSPLNAIVGTNAGVFGASIGQYPNGGLGCGVLVFLSEDASGWHYVNSGCVQNSGFMPGEFDQVFVSNSCANVRSAPSMTGSVVACLKAGTQVRVDSAPTYADGHIWWHLAGRGWMAHDFLLAPNI